MTADPRGLAALAERLRLVSREVLYPGDKGYQAWLDKTAAAILGPSGRFSPDGGLVNVPDLGDVELRSGASPDTTPRRFSPDGGLGSGVRTECPLVGVHDHAFRGPHVFDEWYGSPDGGLDALDVERLEEAIGRAGAAIPETADGGYSDLPGAARVAAEYAALASRALLAIYDAAEGRPDIRALARAALATPKEEQG